MKANGKLTLATVTCPKVACQVTKFTGRINLGEKKLKLVTRVPGSIPAGKSRMLTATLPQPIRRAVRSADPDSIARFAITVVAESEGKVVRPSLKVRIR